MGRGVVDDTSNPVSHSDGVEVQDQTDSVASQAKVGKHLRHVDGQQPVDGLELDHELISDQQVEAVGGVQPDAPVVDVALDLAADSQPELLQLVREADLVRRFEQSWTERPVNRDCGSNHAIREFGWPFHHASNSPSGTRLRLPQTRHPPQISAHDTGSTIVLCSGGWPRHHSPPCPPCPPWFILNRWGADYGHGLRSRPRRKAHASWGRTSGWPEPWPWP